MRIESALTINIEAILGSPRLMYLFTWFCFFFSFFAREVLLVEHGYATSICRSREGDDLP
jgi:hypothetical protein